MGGIRKPPEPPRPSIVRMELETMVLGVCETIRINCMRHFMSYGWSAFCRLLFVRLFDPCRFDSGKDEKWKDLDQTRRWEKESEAREKK